MAHISALSWLFILGMALFLVLFSAAMLRLGYYLPGLLGFVLGLLVMVLPSLKHTLQYIDAVLCPVLGLIFYLWVLKIQKQNGVI